jgi:hypothetical protein
LTVASSGAEAVACAKTHLQRERHRRPSRRYPWQYIAMMEVPTIERNLEEPHHRAVVIPSPTRIRTGRPFMMAGICVEIRVVTGLREAVSSESSVS